MKTVIKRFLSLTLAFLMVLSLLPAFEIPAYAATSGTVTGLADENIGLSFTGDADDAWSANGTSIIGAATSTGGTCSDTSYKSTLTITNKKSTTATLSFDYSIEQNNGKIQVDGTEVSSGASFTKELATNESVKVYIQSGSTSAATKITLTNVVLVSDVNATATFVPAENGTYTVDGKLITEEYSNTQSSMTAYQVVATPADGYQFMGWYDVSNEKYISTSAKAALNIENDCTITARFASKTAALFETGGQRFDDLGDAVSYAQANSQSKITLATDGSISGIYTIPAGITLLIPFDEAGTLYTDAPAVIRTDPASKPFRTLTMSDGASITVNGAISLGGRYYAPAGSQQGRPVGNYGYIKMVDNSSITVKGGGNLYAWGFISGNGSVLAESGATVYEFYQIADFRGGSASSGMGNKVFPFSQYFVQNIEVPLTLNAGANEQVYSGVYAMSTTYTTTIKFIGDTGMFKVESGSFTKDYDEKADRLVFTVNGEAALNTLSLKLAGMSVNSASYVLPITNNITINIQSGNVTINQDAALLAGVEVNIAEGAGLTVANGKNIYFYDSDEWNSDNFVWGPCKFKSVAYAPGKAYNRSNNDLVDAKMDVNGSVTAIGAIYTTKGGADICSSEGTGTYIQEGTLDTNTTTTYQYNANANNAIAIPITPAKLHNADDTYTETKTASAGDVFKYKDGKWLKNPITITFNPGNGSGDPYEQIVDSGEKEVTLEANKFTWEGNNHVFVGWNTKEDGTGEFYDDEAKINPKNLTGDITLYAQWKDGVIVYFDANGGEGDMPKQTIIGDIPVTASLNKNTFTRKGYKFSGWNTEQDGSGASSYSDCDEIKLSTYVTLYAQWTKETDDDIVITYNANGGTGAMEVQSGTVEGIELSANTFTREGYTFTGWNTAADGTGTPYADKAKVALTENITLYAQWEIKTYNITWVDGNGTQLRVDKVKYGETPAYTGETPTKASTAQYEYTFNGQWSPALAKVTCDATYTAQFTEALRSYTVTWVDENGVTTLHSATVDYGVVPEYKGAPPTKENTAEYTYTFEGWRVDGEETVYTGELPKVTGDVTYEAVYNETVNTYTVTWVDEDGTTTLHSATVDYGVVPEYKGAPPTKENTAEYTYTFEGWRVDGEETVYTGELPKVTGDVTYKAVYNETVNTYTVTWNLWDGKTIYSESIPYGMLPEYNADKFGDISALAHQANEEWTYTFQGWNPEITKVTGDITYTAKLAKTKTTYTVTWMLDNNTEIDTTTVDYGATPTHADAVKPKDNYNEYRFTGWADSSGKLLTSETKIYGNTTYYAQFEANDRIYTISFDTGGGTAVDKITGTYNTAVTAPADPTRTGYTFAGWDTEIPEKLTEDLTITAKWTINQYTITFDTAGGSAIAPITQDYGTSVTAPAAPTRTGYTFDGWSRSIPDTMPAENLTITAKWTIKQYTITFDTAGGSTIAPITQDYGTSVTAPEAPTKEGYTFAGWDKDIPEKLTEDLTITARWTVNQYTIRFVDGDHEIKSITQDYGTVITPPEDPTKEGYIFGGWNNLPKTMPVTPEGGLIVSAIWNVGYTLSFVSGYDEQAYYSEIFAAGSDLSGIGTPADPSRIGYTFAGWDNTVPNYMPAENLTITAQWTINQYTITFDTAGGSAVASITQDYGTPVTAPAAPTRTGYTFIGWDKNIPNTMPAENLTITAQWKVNQYSVSFDSDGGTKVDTITADYGTPVYAPQAPTKAGYQFDGWYIGDDQVEFPFNMPENGCSLKAHWIPDKIDITWVVDGVSIVKQADYGSRPEFGSTPEKPATAEYTYRFVRWDPEITDDTVVNGKATYTAIFEEKPVIYTVEWNDDNGNAECVSVAYGEVIPDPVVPTKDLYICDGWYASDGKDNVIEWESGMKMPARDLTFVAHWSKQQYSLTYVYDNGNESTTVNVAWGENISEPSNKPSKTGYEFAGWYNGDSKVVFPFEMPTEDITLTAHWTVKQYTMTFYVDGEIANNLTITKNYNDSVIAPIAPDKDGYTFVKWTPDVPATMPAYDMKFEAVYKFTYTGFKTLSDGKITYYRNGEQPYQNIWTTIEGKIYYFDYDKCVITGLSGKIESCYDPEREARSVFDDNGVFQQQLNGVYTDNNASDVSKYWIVNGEVDENAGLQLVKTDGVKDYYFFDREDGGKAVVYSENREIFRFTEEYRNGLNLPANIWYVPGDDGIIVHDKDTDKQGIQQADSADGLYYFVDGVKTGLGLFKYDGSYYYARTLSGKLVCGMSYWITETNGITINDVPIKQGTYQFDDDGKMILGDLVKDGIVKEDGSLYYYKNGSRYYAGLINIGGSYYYVKTSGEVVHGQKYWITKTNGLMKEASYEFGADGKMVVDESVKDGIVEENGSLYYYKDGKLTYAGLINIDGSYYYVKTSGEVVHGQKYWISKTNGLMPERSYTFDAEGKITDPEIISPDPGKNGIVEENGSLYYYKDGSRYYAGLINIEGSYYYVKTSGEVVHGQKYWITKTNGLMKEASYEFGTDGKMVVE